MSKTEEEKIDRTVEDIFKGLELTVKELQSKLPDEVDAMSTKQLRRALKAVILYPNVDDSVTGNMTPREQKFMASMLALHQAGVQLEIKVIGELQEEYDQKQKNKQTTGEE